MASSNREISSIGSSIHYGPRSAENGYGACIGNLTGPAELVYDFDFDDLPTNSEFDAVVPTIPAGATVIEARLEVSEAFTGATQVDVGLSEPDGTVVDADGLIAAGSTAVGWVKGAGAYLDISVGANPVQVTVAATGATAGKGTLHVKYIQPGSVVKN